MVGVFCFVEIKEMPEDGCYLFDSEELANEWMVERLIDAGIAKAVDGGWELYDEPGVVHATREEAIFAFQESLGGLSFFHIYDAFDKRGAK